MIERAHVIGAGRVGSAIAARLRERGLACPTDDPSSSSLCVPDGAIAEVAASVEPGPWVAHVSGATPLAALDPHAAPLQRPPAPDVHARARRRAARRRLGGGHGRDGRGARRRRSGSPNAGPASLRPRRRRSALYHAGAAIASNYLVTLHRAAGSLLEAPARRPRRSMPLMRRTIENGFELTGPIARGDWATVEAHLAAIRAERAGARAAVRALAEATRRSVRTSAPSPSCARRSAVRPGTRRPGADDGRAPRRASSRCSHAARARVRHRRRQPLRQPGAVRRGRGPRRAIRATRQRDAAMRPRRESTSCSRRRRGDVPGRLPDLGRRRELSRGARGRVPARPLPRRRDRLPEALQHRPAAASPTSARRTRSRSRSSGSMVRDLDLDSRSASCPTVRDPDGLAISSRNVRLSPEERAGARWLFPGRSRRATPRPRARAARRARASTTSRSPTSTPPVLAAAVRVGSTRLIDNVILDEEDTMTTRPRKPAPGTPAPGKLPLTELAEMKRARRADRHGDRVRRAERHGSRTPPAST